MKIDKAIEILNNEKNDCIVGFEKDRNLKEAIETVLKELEESQADLTTVYIKGVCDEKSRWRDKIREKIEKLADSVSHYNEGEINYKIDALKELLGELANEN